MARINIEECWWSDPRRSMLIRLIGDEEKADGAAVKMWRLAQEFWKRERQLVPIYIFNTLLFASALLESALAEERDGGVYIRGSSQYLEWVKDKSAAGRMGGLKSAEVRLAKFGSAQPTATRSTTEASFKAAQNATNATFENPNFALANEENSPNAGQKHDSNPEADAEATSKQSKQPEPSSSVSGSNINTIAQIKICAREKPSFDLEKLYQRYPRKRNKAPGMRRLAKEIKTEADYQSLSQAIDNYAKEVEGREIRHIAYFSTFASNWKDWVNVEPDPTQFAINTTPISLEAL